MTQPNRANNPFCWLFGHDLVSVQTQRGKSRSGCLRCGKHWVYDHPRASWLEFRSDWKGNAAYAAGRMSRDKKIAALKERNERQRQTLEFESDPRTVHLAPEAWEETRAAIKSARAVLVAFDAPVDTHPADVASGLQWAIDVDLRRALEVPLTVEMDPA